MTMPRFPALCALLGDAKQRHRQQQRHPAAYKGTANAMILWGGTCATTNKMVPAMSMLRPWSTKRVPWS